MAGHGVPIPSVTSVFEVGSPLPRNEISAIGPRRWFRVPALTYVPVEFGRDDLGARRARRGGASGSGGDVLDLGGRAAVSDRAPGRIDPGGRGARSAPGSRWWPPIRRRIGLPRWVVRQCGSTAGWPAVATRWPRNRICRLGRPPRWLPSWNVDGLAVTRGCGADRGGTQLRIPARQSRAYGLGRAVIADRR